MFEGRKLLRQTTEMTFVVDKDFIEDEDKFDEGNLIYFPNELIEILAWPVRQRLKLKVINNTCIVYQRWKNMKRLFMKKKIEASKE